MAELRESDLARYKFYVHTFDFPCVEVHPGPVEVHPRVEVHPGPALLGRYTLPFRVANSSTLVVSVAVHH